MTKIQKIINLIFILSVVVILLVVVIRNHQVEKQVLRDPVEVIAEISQLKSCGKYGRCIFFKYNYNGQSYTSRSRVDVLFSRWCNSKNDCVGLKFKIKVLRSEPEKIIVDWKKVLDDKEFVNINNFK